MALEDLLGRDPVELDTALLSRRITDTRDGDRRAGSIGSELCRQIARLSPSRLVMFEIAESPLFDFEMEMRKRSDGERGPVIGDVRDRARVEETFGCIGRPSCTMRRRTSSAHDGDAPVEA